jgi:hypothetical protein
MLIESTAVPVPVATAESPLLLTALTEIVYSTPPARPVKSTVVALADSVCVVPPGVIVATWLLIDLPPVAPIVQDADNLFRPDAVIDKDCGACGTVVAVTGPAVAELVLLPNPF